MSRVVGIVLAAGESTRMGSKTAKQLLPWGDDRVISAVVRAALSSSVDEVVVVVGHRGDEVAAAVRAAAPDATVVHHSGYAAGPWTSLQAGAAAAPADAYVAVPGDMPEITAEAISAVADAWRRDRPVMAVARYAGPDPRRRAHPLAVAADVVSRLDELPRPSPLWRLLETLPIDDVSIVDLASPAPGDLDTPEDYLAARHRVGGPEAQRTDRG